MNGGIPELLPDHGQQHFNSFSLPTKDARKQSVTVGAHGFFLSHLMPSTKLFQFGIFGPCAYWYLWLLLIMLTQKMEKESRTI